MRGGVMVAQRSLEPLIGVRIPAPQLGASKACGDPERLKGVEGKNNHDGEVKILGEYAGLSSSNFRETEHAGIYYPL